jgi:DNA-directed RNA polymerase specialized sigma24 family protein
VTSVTTDVARGMATSMQLERAPVARQARADWPAPASPAPPSPAPAAVPLLEAAEPLMPPRPDLAARFDELMVQYDRLIRAIVARLGRRFGLSRDSFLVQDDIAQEVRFDIWKQIARGQVIDFPATYIYKATIRETVRALRRMTTREMESIEEKGVADQVVDGADPFKLLAARDQFKAIVAGIRALAPDRQAAVTAHLSGFQFQEVMVMHGWSYQKARNLVARGMADLRAGLCGEPKVRRRRTNDPRLAAIHTQLEALRANLRALQERRQTTVRLESTRPWVRK